MPPGKKKWLVVGDWVEFDSMISSHGGTSVFPARARFSHMGRVTGIHPASKSATVETIVANWLREKTVTMPISRLRRPWTLKLT